MILKQEGYFPCLECDEYEVKGYYAAIAASTPLAENDSNTSRPCYGW